MPGQKPLRRQSKPRSSSIIIRQTRISPSASTCLRPNKAPDSSLTQRPTPNLDGWVSIESDAPETDDVRLDGWIENALLNIEHAPTNKIRKRLATKLFFSLYGKPEDLSPYYAGGPPITGLDVNGKTYSF